MTDREALVAAEIRRLAREELGLTFEAGDDEELAGRLDSLALLSLVVAVEDRFRVRIREDDAAATRSLADLARLVAERTGAARTEATP
ncbi:MAG TPA: acyl carrier protein [Anaeromyxobacteraceae bacterium]|nr:acyl carrier protein [Anaeromyxobacteraceae bacterium]